MNRKIVIWLLIAVVLSTISLAEAQQTGEVRRVGFLAGSSPSFYSARIEAFRRGLQELGHIEGKNILIDYRFAEGKDDRLPSLVAELVRLKVEVIVTGGRTPTRAAKEATATIPIVMTVIGDPVGEGLVSSLARPGGNITGLTQLSPELSGKRLELLKETIPRVTRVAVLSDPTTASVTVKAVEAAAQTLAVQLQSLEVRSPKDIETAFQAASKGRADAVLVPTTAVTNAHRKLIVDLAAKMRLPAMYGFRRFVEAGGLMSYSADDVENFRRAATYVDKILKGRKPADLPVEQPMKFEFVINLKTAKQIGLTIPPNVLARADRVIK
ncbi:MAG: ABC transporter substrate-binding protein [Deltaproteobacteria bacterium]|nr:ABC transporter substrate-binding protein [Deltaproteobacteria bacterium]